MTFQLDVVYTKSQIGQWLPSSWSSRNLKSDGSVTIAYRGKCTIESINPKLAENEFQLSFPAGTKVHDYTSGESRPNQPDQYIIRTDGSERHIRPTDRNRSYDELLNSTDPAPTVVQLVYHLQIRCPVCVVLAVRLDRHSISSQTT